MGLLNHLFGDNKKAAKRLELDEEKRLVLWDAHLNNFPQREALAKHFRFGQYIEQALINFDETRRVLQQIEALIPPELITLEEEEKEEEILLRDLDKLRNDLNIGSIARELVQEKKKQAALLIIFKEIHDTLILEHHLIKLVLRKPSKELLERLFRLIFFNEAALYKAFRAESYSQGSISEHAAIVKLARSVLLEQELEEEIETEEDLFVKAMVAKMAYGKSGRYRDLGEDIFLALTERAKASLTEDEDIGDAALKMDTMIEDQRTLYLIVRKLRPKYKEDKIRLVIDAFLKAHHLGHFEELEVEWRS
jgi:hypothetical protein